MFPAYAGVNRLFLWLVRVFMRVPRIRGGEPGTAHIGIPRMEVFPAYAGVKYTPAACIPL